MIDDNLDSVAEQMLTDSIEILTILVVAWNIERGALEDIEDIKLNELDNEIEIEIKNHRTSPNNIETVKVSRADNMRKIREEQLKMSNNRKMRSARDSPDMPEIANKEKVMKHMRQANTMKGKRLLSAADVDNRLVQDKSAKMNIIGAEVEALYPSLEAIQVADIVYKAVMETEIEFKNINYQEGVRYIALTSAGVHDWAPEEGATKEEAC